MATDSPAVCRAVEEVFGPATFNDDLSALLLLQPDRQSNQVGVAVGSAIVAHTKACLPGDIRTPAYNWLVDEGSCRSLFYPGYAYDPNEDVAVQTLGGDQTLWQPLSVAVLSQLAYLVASKLSRMLRIGEIESDLAALNGQIAGGLAACYAGALSRALPTFGRLVARLGGQSAALALYDRALTGEPWIAMLNEQLRNGTLADPEWFFFHHWIKLAALQCPAERIDAVINLLAARLIDLPASARSDRWRGYQVWYSLGGVRYDQFREAEARLLASATLEQTHYGTGATHFIKMPEWYANTFCQSEGKKYYAQPSSCFSAGAQVRMADGALRPISAVRVGDLVATPQGGRRVAVVVGVPRFGQPMYAIAGHSFLLTPTHPLRCAPTPGGPRAACVEPRRAGMILPTLQRLGLAALDAATTLLTYTPDGPAPFRTEGLARFDPETDEKAQALVYDLILQPDEQGLPDYYVGDAQRQFLASSEMPVFVEAPLATQVVLAAMGAVEELFAGAGAAPQAEGQPWFLLCTALLGDLIPSAAALAQSSTVAVTSPDAPLSALVDAHLRLLRDPEDQNRYHRLSGELFAMLLAAHGEELEATIDLGWRHMPAPDAPTDGWLALSLLSVNVDAHRPLPAENGLAVTAALANLPAQTVHGQPHSGNTPFTHHLHEVIYLDPAALSVEGPTIPIEFRIQAADGAAPLSAAGRLLWPLQVPYQYAQAPIQDTAGDGCGYVLFDLRVLSEDQAAAEQAARSGWTDEQRQNFAAALGAAVGAGLAGRLAALLPSAGATLA
ncbi:MAG TPA: hypothetical protein VFS21_22960 [Roseiflexaceae bacterium]|nr:hypothetical protein [Roseiflexaceae bacterium]